MSTLHRSAGAVLGERDGWLLPIHFGNAAAEYHAVRSALGLIDRSDRALLQITGPDRLSFLQGMLSNDLRKLAPGEGQHAAILNQQGKVLGDVRVLCSENSFYLDLWDFIKDKIVAHLNRYLVADEVEIADRSEAYPTLSVQGPRAAALVQKITGRDQLPERRASHIMVEIAGAQVCAVRDSHTGEAGFDFIIPRDALETIAQRLTEAAAEFPGAWVGEEAQNTLRIEAGIPRYGIDLTEDNLLLEAGLNDAVSFTKGCYLGQEVVERIRSRGHVNRKLMGLLLDTDSAAPAGAPLLAEGKAVGSVTSSVYSPKLARAVALGYVHKEFWEPGTRLSVERGGATVAALPFVPAADEPEPSS